MPLASPHPCVFEALKLDVLPEIEFYFEYRQRLKELLLDLGFRTLGDFLNKRHTTVGSCKQVGNQLCVAELQ